MRRHKVVQIIVEDFGRERTWLTVKLDSATYPHTQSVSIPFKNSTVPLKEMTKRLQRHKQ